MDDTKTLQALSVFLMDRGFTANLIDRSSGKTPDLYAGDGENTYLLEVKTRLDSKEPSIMRTDPIIRLNKFSGIVAKATKQLRTMASENTIRMLWFLGQPPHQETFYEQLRMTLYGIRFVVGRRKTGRLASACYYAGHSDFIRFRDSLDGALLGTVAAIFINDHSPRADLLKNSRLCTLAGSYTLDPRDLEKAGEVLVLRDSVDRSDEPAVLRCIENRYGIENAQFERIVKFSTFVP